VEVTLGNGRVLKADEGIGVCQESCVTGRFQLIG
jgi:hypothetical protein